MKILLSVLIFVPFFAGACPQFNKNFSCKRTITYTVQTVDRFQIRIDNHDQAFTITKKIVGRHETENGEIVDGPYVRSYEAKIGTVEGPILDENSNPVGQAQTIVSCEANSLRIQNKAQMTDPIWEMETWETFSLQENDSMVYANSNLMKPIRCVESP